MRIQHPNVLEHTGMPGNIRNVNINTEKGGKLQKWQDELLTFRAKALPQSNVIREYSHF